jgi:hypothetical protein
MIAIVTVSAINKEIRFMIFRSPSVVGTGPARLAGSSRCQPKLNSHARNDFDVNVKAPALARNCHFYQSVSDI